ncbi:hypothetical protein [Microbacterium oleivorans]|uniref:Uncharacterized protein n=1 Tax=Microbacterium oleivorans TaxID=273677 RepID=A0A4R5YF68_9MICO|nr:hypothetical protein [Microbacterium oleivorans]TDL43603.1 hypothetical protein E2R54_10340 [Microbacterium oleivorans]
MTIREVALNNSLRIQVRTGASSWKTLSQDATQLSITRGAGLDGVTTKTDVGIATFLLKNAEDPMNGGTLLPGQDIRIQGYSPVRGFVAIFTGRIADLSTVYPYNKSDGTSRAMTQVTVADAVKVHVNTMRYGVETGAGVGFETFESRINRLSASAQAPIEVPVIGAPREVYAF